MNRRGVAGRRGEGIRSDAYIAVELRDGGGIELAVKSRVDFIYGDSIRALVFAGLSFFGIQNAWVEVEDSGAMPFVLMARLETAVRRALGKDYKDVAEWLPEPGPSFALPSVRERWRRSRLYLPGNEPKFMLNARIHEPDGVILDLEDSVPPEDKDAALVLVRNALIAVDFAACERMVRINPLPRGREELEPLIRAGVNVVVVPKCEDDAEIKKLAAEVVAIEKRVGVRHQVWLMPIIETAAGVFRAYEIARSSERIAALTYGLEDYIADIGAQKTRDGWEALWLRSVVVNAARSAGVQPIDTVYADVADLEGLKFSCLQAKALGFEGKGCIHPRQVRVVNEAFTPDDEEIAHAMEIVKADMAARAKGKSVAVIGSKMIDPPVVRRARRTLELAVALGRLSPDWNKEG
ncbi:MAG: aldolase/citrate lyase family protein [candidate division WOR-3 bacterium]|uniref:Citrate lyase ACP n=1 Tax=candidate division WOR-3 bacterium TaxID=2052148 RepID=A0A7C3IWH9_UNCW3|nr:aldolase/citrate lyase family protein [candidate division WOR-3 bacterium]